jgi:hypothetical protein
LHHGRPPGAQSRMVFIMVKAPYQAFTSTAVSVIVARAAKKVRPRHDPRSPAAPYGRDNDVARRRIVVGDWTTAASPQHYYNGDLC